MKIPMVLLATAVLIACSVDEDEEVIVCFKPTERFSDSCIQTWQLVKMTGNIANVKPTTGSDMPIQERYVFYPNLTFAKIREHQNEVLQEEGTYLYKVLSDGEYLELKYELENSLIANCWSDATELLRFNDANNELSNVWVICDGSGMFYEIVQSDCEESF